MRSVWVSVVVGALLTTACGGSTDADGAGGSSGSGGSGAASGSGGDGGSGGGPCHAIVPCCDSQGNQVPYDCRSGIPLCPEGSTVPPTGICKPAGCSPSSPCGSSEYCDYPDDLCGSGELGECKPRPGGCFLNYDPVCGCDGQVHGNACSAQMSGTDASATASCAPPGGSYQCGTTFCSVGQEYCQISLSDVAGAPHGYSCQPIPSGCGPTITCGCLESEPCGGLCEMSAPGQITLTCPGG